MGDFKINKILIVTDTMAIGGTEKLTVLLANGFAMRGYECMIMVLRNDLSSLNDLKTDRVKFDYAYRKYRLDFYYTNKMLKVIDTFKPDIILCQALFSYISVKLATAFKKKIPTFLSLHYTYNYCLKDELVDRLYFLLLRFNEDKIISIYKNQQDYFSKKYHIPKERFELISSGIDTNWFKKEHSEKDLINRLHIVHVGNIKPEKDQLILLRALQLLDAKNVNWELTFCGRDQIGIKKKLIEFSLDSGIDKKINFIDFIEDAREVLEYADVFVLSSISEALPVSALEAMAMGVPCVLTNVGGCSDIVDDGENGYLVPTKNAVAIADKLDFLLENKEVLNLMKIKAREKIERKFNSIHMIDGYLNLFQRETL